MTELTADDRAMLAAYTQLATRIWGDENAKQRALEDPSAALAEIGWDVPAGTNVEIALVEPEGQSQKFDLEAIVAGWREEIDAGDLRIVIPSKPKSAEPEALSDEELAEAAGGGDSPACFSGFSGMGY